MGREKIPLRVCLGFLSLPALVVVGSFPRPASRWLDDLQLVAGCALFAFFVWAFVSANKIEQRKQDD